MRPDIRVLGQHRAGGTGTNSAARATDSREPVDDRPRSVYELMTRKMLEELKEDVSEIKGRVNTLLWLVIGAMLIEVVMRLVK